MYAPCTAQWAHYRICKGIPRGRGGGRVNAESTKYAPTTPSEPKPCPGDNNPSSMPVDGSAVDRGTPLQGQRLSETLNANNKAIQHRRRRCFPMGRKSHEGYHLFDQTFSDRRGFWSEELSDIHLRSFLPRIWGLSSGCAFIVSGSHVLGEVQSASSEQPQKMMVHHHRSMRHGAVRFCFCFSEETRRQNLTVRTM